MDFYMLGQKIRTLRTLHHYSQADLAERIDVSTNYIGQIERGDRKPSLETLVELCNALNTSMDYMLSDSIVLSGEQLSVDILTKLNQLSMEERAFFYHTINNYIQMKQSTHD